MKKLKALFNRYEPNITVTLLFTVVPTLATWIVGQLAGFGTMENFLIRIQAYLIVFGLITLFLLLVRRLWRRFGGYSHLSNKIEFVPFSHEGYASIEIINHHSKPLQCFAILNNVLHVDGKTKHDIARQINPNNSKLSWSGGSPSEVKTIDAKGGKETINILQAVGFRGDDVYFNLYEGNRQYPAHDFIVDIEVRGYIDNRAIKPIHFHSRIVRASTTTLGLPTFGSDEKGIAVFEFIDD